MIDGYVKRSPAWKALTPVERNAYIEVKWRYDGTNNGRIGLGCRELAEELSMSRNTADRALHTLVSLGFIVVAKPSAFHVKNRAATEWRLTEYGCDVTGDLPSKEFMRWEPKKKQQSHPRDTQSHPRDCDPVERAEKHADSPTHGTVKPLFQISQSHPRDTYRSTIPPSELEAGVTALGALVQPLTNGEASKRSGRRSPAQREQSKKFLSSLEERRASARAREDKAKADRELLIATIMGSGQ
jgi:hypothetical protein